ncbi:hypothetical protein [Cerasicoccus fimbriatus]|uniref:hypothetical protein n=1 Tax=Cerasicoccus fimbriatus TaxID=3014554 RepID=UPI0022B53029|nr:hypothetical protein [Cerasicoccus sp. TK19100]
MIRVRRSSIRRFNSPDDTALICFLSLTLGSGGAVRGCALMRPPSADHDFVQAAEQAARMATEVRAGTVFSYWQQLRDALASWQKTNDKPAAAAAFGVAIIERALMDAFCRGTEKPFAACLRDNDFKIELGKVCRPLKGRHPSDLLMPVNTGSMPLQMLIAPDAPQAQLDEAVAKGYRNFSLGLTGQASTDLLRIISLAESLDRIEGRYAVSLEGNAAFTEARALRELWDGVKSTPELKKFSRSIVCIEQPFAVDDTLSNAALALFAEWPDRPAIIIDESDDEFGACARALEWGYAGTVFRAERGIIPGIIDACLLGARRDREPIGKWTMIGGPLSNGLPLAQLSEIAATAALGLGSCTVSPATFEPIAADVPWREDIASAHTETFDSDLCLQASGGGISLGEIFRAPFGCLPQIDAAVLAHA